MESVKNRVLSQIYGRGRGQAFTPNDFSNDFKRWEISNSLEDLVNLFKNPSKTKQHNKNVKKYTFFNIFKNLDFKDLINYFIA